MIDGVTGDGTIWVSYLFVCGVVAMAALLQSVAGFGFNLIAVSLLTLVLSPREVVPAMIVAWTPLGLALTARGRRNVTVPRVACLLAGALPGLLVGTWLLAAADPLIMKRFIGAIAVISVVLLVSSRGRPFRRERPWIVAAGAVSGVLGGSTAMSGPPVVLLGLNQAWEPAHFRADLIGYFTALHLIMVGLLFWRGLLTPNNLTLAGASVPGLVLGYMVGVRVAFRVSPRHFRRLVIAILCVAGVTPWITGW